MCSPVGPARVGERRERERARERGKEGGDDSIFAPLLNKSCGVATITSSLNSLTPSTKEPYLCRPLLQYKPRNLGSLLIMDTPLRMCCRIFECVVAYCSVV